MVSASDRKTGLTLFLNLGVSLISTPYYHSFSEPNVYLAQLQMELYHKRKPAKIRNQYLRFRWNISFGIEVLRVKNVCENFSFQGCLLRTASVRKFRIPDYVDTWTSETMISYNASHYVRVKLQKQEILRTLYLTRHHATWAGQVTGLTTCDMIEAKIMKYNTPSCMLVAKLVKFGQSLLNRTENSS